jgi:hypothetical protein
VTGYGLDDCYHDCRLWQLQGPLITVLGRIYATAAPSEDADNMFLPWPPVQARPSATCAHFNRSEIAPSDDWAWFQPLAALRFAIISIRTSQRNDAFGVVRAPEDPDGLITFVPHLRHEARRRAPMNGAPATMRAVAQTGGGRFGVVSRVRRGE